MIIIIFVKGMAAYAEHAHNLGYDIKEILVLLHLGVKNIHLGPTLPGFPFSKCS